MKARFDYCGQFLCSVWNALLFFGLAAIPFDLQLAHSESMPDPLDDTLEALGGQASQNKPRIRERRTSLQIYDGTSGVDAEAEETRYRRLVENWNGTVKELRKIEGFSRCLFSPLFSDLQDA
ncbi:hypothetical protein C8R48DRAFT_760395 [Suillus tomentosus]|nr:hypothetical protein C8R48DRAFT_760395 [Suillus tomentosus]